MKPDPIPVLFFRHGLTAGNLGGRYVGATDEPLHPKGREALLRLRASFSECGITLPETVYASPLLRCRESAELLFPGVPVTVVPDFRECAFGAFEYRNFAELDGDPAYQAYVDSGGTLAFPGGEEPAAFRKRCREAFLANVPVRRTASVVHGGTVMAVLDAFSEPHRDYFDWQVKNACGFSGFWNPGEQTLTGLRPI